MHVKTAHVDTKRIEQKLSLCCLLLEGDGAQGGADEPDADEDDDLLVVKRRDVLDSADPAAVAADGVPLGGVELRGNKKRKRMRIDPGKTSGARTVFDEAGESLQPLALLAKEQLDRSAAHLVLHYTNAVCCAVLCCAVLCCAVLCCAVLCCAVLCCAVLCCAGLGCALLACAVPCYVICVSYAVLYQC